MNLSAAYIHDVCVYCGKGFDIASNYVDEHVGSLHFTASG